MIQAERPDGSTIRIDAKPVASLRIDAKPLVHPGAEENGAALPSHAPWSRREPLRFQREHAHHLAAVPRDLDPCRTVGQAVVAVAVATAVEFHVLVERHYASLLGKTPD